MGKFINQDQYLREMTKSFTALAKPLANRPVPTNLNDLCDKIREAFDYTEVDLEYVNHLLFTYKSNPADWKDFVNFDDKVYTRNLLDAGNGKYNLIVLCWNTKQQSPIHDHSDSNCFMKMLQGELVEVRYNRVSDKGACCNSDEAIENRKLVEVAQKNIKTNDVCYINDNIGLHLVRNPSADIGAISLHLYCPAFKFCKVYEKSGESKTCEMKFHTKFGRPTEN